MTFVGAVPMPPECHCVSFAKIFLGGSSTWNGSLISGCVSISKASLPAGLRSTGLWTKAVHYFLKTDYHLFSQVLETRLRFQISWPDIEQWPVLIVKSTAVCETVLWPLTFCRAGLFMFTAPLQYQFIIYMYKTNAE